MRRHWPTWGCRRWVPFICQLDEGTQGGGRRRTATHPAVVRPRLRVSKTNSVALRYRATELVSGNPGLVRQLGSVRNSRVHSRGPPRVAVQTGGDGRSRQPAGRGLRCWRDRVSGQGGSDGFVIGRADMTATAMSVRDPGEPLGEGGRRECPLPVRCECVGRVDEIRGNSGWVRG